MTAEIRYTVFIIYIKDIMYRGHLRHKFLDKLEENEVEHVLDIPSVKPLVFYLLFSVFLKGE
jgi:hypothetical protein